MSDCPDCPHDRAEHSSHCDVRSCLCQRSGVDLDVLDLGLDRMKLAWEGGEMEGAVGHVENIRLFEGKEIHFTMKDVHPDFYAALTGAAEDREIPITYSVEVDTERVYKRPSWLLHPRQRRRWNREVGRKRKTYTTPMKMSFPVVEIRQV